MPPAKVTLAKASSAQDAAVDRRPGNSGRVKLDDDLISRLADVVRAGNYIDVAASYLGISRQSFYRWMREGRDIDRTIESGAATEDSLDDYSRLRLRLSRELDLALATAEVRDLALIGRAAEENWTAAAWRLERKYPDRYGKRVAVANADGQPFRVQATPMFDPSKLSDDELDTLIDLLGKAQPDQHPVIEP